MFITIEGIEGSGKTTLINLLSEYFSSRGEDVIVTREPGGCELGGLLRSLVLSSELRLTTESELFLFLADRAQHVSECIQPAIMSGKTVFCDRYADSTIVYQGYGRGMNIGKLWEFNEVAIKSIWPQKTLLLDIDVEKALERACVRNETLGLNVVEGRFESEPIDFHNRIRDGFLHWAERNPDRITILNADTTPEQLFQQAVSVLKGIE